MNCRTGAPTKGRSTVISTYLPTLSNLSMESGGWGCVERNKNLFLYYEMLNYGKD